MLLARTDHRRIGLAAEGARKCCEVRQGTDHTVLGDRVRVFLDHEALLFRAGFIAPPLPPGDKELLIGREAIEGRCRVLLLRLLESQE